MAKWYFSPDTLSCAKNYADLSNVHLSNELYYGEVVCIDEVYYLVNECENDYLSPNGHPISKDAVLVLDDSGNPDSYKWCCMAKKEHAQNCTQQGVIDKRLFVEKEN
jgi:hypothetical protein